MNLLGQFTDQLLAPVLAPGGIVASPAAPVSLMHGLNCACGQCAAAPSGFAVSDTAPAPGPAKAPAAETPPSSAESPKPSATEAEAEQSRLMTNDQFLTRWSLKLAGIFNLIGDIAFFGNGIKTGNPYKIAGGTLYTLGGANLTRYGKVNKEHTLRDVTERTAEFIQTHAGEIPQDSQLATTLKQKRTGALADLDRFLYRQPGQNTMALYTAGAAAMLGSGIKKYRAGEGAAGLYYGLSSLLFKFISFIVPEESTAEKSQSDASKKKGFIAWIKEKPLRVFGYGSLITDSLLAWEAWQEYKRAPEKGGHVWTAITSATYMLADLFMAISHKDPANAEGRFTPQEKEKLTAMAAEALAHQPEEKREQLIDKTAEFLSAQPEVKGNAQVMKKSLSEKIAKMSEKLWAVRAEETPQPALAYAR